MPTKDWLGVNIRSLPAGAIATREVGPAGDSASSGAAMNLDPLGCDEGSDIGLTPCSRSPP